MSTLTTSVLERTLLRQNVKRQRRLPYTSISDLQRLVTELTREVPLTTESRKFPTFSDRLQSLLDYLSSTNNLHEEDSGELLRQLHRLLLLSLSHHVATYRQGTTFALTTATSTSTTQQTSLFCIEKMIETLSQLYRIPTFPLANEEAEEALLHLLKTLIPWVACTQRNDSYRCEMTKSIFLLLVHVTEQLCSKKPVHPKVSFRYRRYCCAVLQRFWTSPQLDNHDRVAVHHLLSRLQPRH